MAKPVLYSYWRSSCSWRVRIALNLKGIDYEYKAVHLVRDGGEQNKDEYRALNPLGQVPTFVTEDGTSIAQSLAIIEYLEERYPEKTPLLPKDILKRAKAREICEMINSGIQPVQNLSVMNKVTDDPAKRTEWSKYWIEKGLTAVEKLLEESSGKFCVGDDLTFADCCIVPQVYNANRFNVNMDQFPIINRIMNNLEPLEEFVAAHPDQQPDKQ